MKKITWILLFLFAGLLAVKLIFTNPGFPEKETYKIKNYVDAEHGFIDAVVSLELRYKGDEKIYHIETREGDLFRNVIELRYKDLTTLLDRRYDLKQKELIEEVRYIGNNRYYFFNKEKGINKVYKNVRDKIYTRYAYMFSFRGFPFQKQKEVHFQSLMFEYPLAPLGMRLKQEGHKSIETPAGTFLCYKLELSVDGWQSNFARDKWYLYFTVDKPHHFVKFEQKVAGGKWLSNELLEYLIEK